MGNEKLTLVLDVDGVLTEGTFLYDCNGKSHKIFGAEDSDALKLIKPFLNDIIFVSADKRGFEISKKRIEDMGFRVECVPSKERIEWIKNNVHGGLKSTIYIGDSFEDIPIINAVFFSIVPKNSLEILFKYADYISPRKGGDRFIADCVFFLLENKFKESIIDVMKQAGYSFED